MAGTVVADTLQADSTSTLVLKNGVANTPPTIQDSAGTQIGTFCRAFVNFNGTTVTNPASMTGVRGSFNVSSILDNGVGDYTINFTTAMPDANYQYSLNSANLSTTTNYTAIFPVAGAITTSSIQVRTIGGASGYQAGSWSVSKDDKDFVNVAIFR